MRAHTSPRTEAHAAGGNDFATLPCWTGLWRDLATRGGRRCHWVIGDAHHGLAATIHPAFPGAPWQRCRVHALRNLLRHALSLDAWARRKTWLCCTTPAVTAAVHGHRMRAERPRGCCAAPLTTWRVQRTTAGYRRAVAGTRPQAVGCLVGGPPDRRSWRRIISGGPARALEGPRDHTCCWRRSSHAPNSGSTRRYRPRPVRSRTPRFTSFCRLRATPARGSPAP